jgi:hypothetical protein
MTSVSKKPGCQYQAYIGDWSGPVCEDEQTSKTAAWESYLAQYPVKGWAAPKELFFSLLCVRAI